MRAAPRRASALAGLTLVAACGPAEVELPARGIGNARPFADAGTGSTHRVRTPITLDGRGSFDPDGQIVAYRWSVVMSPLPTPDALADANAPVATLVPEEVGTPDLPGVYVLEFAVSDGELWSTTPATGTVSASAPP